MTTQLERGIILFCLISSSFCFFWGPSPSAEEIKERKRVFKNLWAQFPEEFQKSSYSSLLSEKDFHDISTEHCPSVVPLQVREGAYYSSKLSSGQYPCTKFSLSTIDVSRFGDIHSFVYVPGCTTFRDLLNSVREKFEDNLIDHLWYRDGKYIDQDELVKPLPKPETYQPFLIATRRLRRSSFGYENVEGFFYPAPRVGEIVPLHLPDSTGNVRVVNLTTVSIHPRIFLLEPFLSEEECDELLDYMNNLPPESKTEWIKSKVGRDHRDEADGGTLRVSETLWLGRIHDNMNPLALKLQSRSQILLKHPPELLEPLQAVRYPTKGHYYFHTDSFPFEDRENAENPVLRGGGNRLATLLMYISASKEGGHTAFPLAEGSKVGREALDDPQLGCDPEKSFVVAPKKGSAVLFYDLLEEKHMDGIFDELSEHAGCDTDGDVQKVILNQWFRNKRIFANDHWNLYDENW